MQIGIEIGGTKLQIAAGDPLSGRIDQLYRYEVDQDQGAAGILTRIEASIALLPEMPQQIGIGFGGPLDPQTGVVAASHQIGGWADFNLKRWFQDRYAAEVRMENDANVAALGETLLGAGRHFHKVFYITLGSGVGGGMLVGGQLYQGNRPGEAEVGMLQVDRLGRNLESYCSGWALDAQIRAMIRELPQESILKREVGDHTRGESRFLLNAWQQGDPAAISLLHRYADHLAWGLSHVAHLFNPEVIILGGGVSLIGDPLRMKVQEILPRYLVKTFLPGPSIVLAELKEEAVLVGALCLLR